MKKYKVTLTVEERQSLLDLIAAASAVPGGSSNGPRARVNRSREVGTARDRRLSPYLRIISTICIPQIGEWPLFQVGKDDRAIDERPVARKPTAPDSHCRDGGPAANINLALDDVPDEYRGPGVYGLKRRFDQRVGPALSRPGKSH